MIPKIGDIVIRRMGTHKGIIKGDICVILKAEQTLDFGYLIDVKRLIDNFVAHQAVYEYFSPHFLIEYEDVV